MYSTSSILRCITCLQSTLITIFYACLPKTHYYGAYRNTGRIIDVEYNNASKKRIYRVRIQGIVFV